MLKLLNHVKGNFHLLMILLKKKCLSLMSESPIYNIITIIFSVIVNVNVSKALNCFE